ncbi:MAG: tRNA dimethylallyltransferase [Verrucomicrobiales bacterium]|nr:tRNA dimethylallyltransferase [Verrucomicrobiales bacterium]
MTLYPLPEQQPIFIAGPTAVGKSAVALALAEKIAGEIISVDSMQVYRGLDIGTAKPSAAERVKIPHHFIDVAELTGAVDAAKFCELAQRAVVDICARKRIPIFCGGTGLYFKAFLEGLGEAPPSDVNLRAELEASPLETLLSELQEKDLVTFDRIDQKNPRRVIRAIEVIRLTGKPFSEQRSAWQKPTAETPDKRFLFGLSREPGDLRRRIDFRVDEMFAQGLVNETQSLLASGLDGNQTALQAIGYRQVVEHLRGERSLAETVELVKIRTRQYAKRQMTWFRRKMYLDWTHLTPTSEPGAIVETILSKYHACSR